LLRVRREETVLSEPRGGQFDGAVLADRVLALRWFAGDPHAADSDQRAAGDRLLVVNMGADLLLPTVAEPLVAPPAGALWEIRWSSEDTAYGGVGTAPLDTSDGWRIPGQAAVLLAPRAPRLP
jgi:maltooligosyltrehalose trehalohydrolase